MSELSRILQNIHSTVNRNYGFKKIFLLFVFFSSGAQAEIASKQSSVDKLYLDEIIQRSQQMGLSQHTAWQDLLHYKPSVLGGLESQVDDAAFFLAVRGKQDAAAELSASLQSFFSKQTSQHPQCLFPARLHWLNSQLDFAAQLPVVTCPKLDSWTEKVDAESVTMLFPSMYLHNPGSMFGHTFLRLNKKENSNLLNYTLSYAAAYDRTDSMLSYVYNGISGGYNGVFSVQPYYETVRSYGDIEQRDIWEYSLNLSTEEVAQLVRHIWEVSNLEFDYYFFRENCSYRLLSLLDVARPGMNMTRDHHLLYAIPVDTVRNSRKAMLIDDEQYRPARLARVEQMYSQMNEASQQQALNISRNFDISLTQFSLVEQAKILETASEISQLNDAEDEASEKILSARSRIKLEHEDKLFEFSSHRPDDGHESARWSIAYGEQERNAYTEIGLRPSFHDLMDNHQGFVKGTAITVLDTRLRWYEMQDRLQLERLSFFSMTALSPVKPWGSPLSGRLNLLIDRENISQQKKAKVFNVDAALGYAFEWGDSLFYALADSQLAYSRHYDEAYIFSLGAEVGALLMFEHSRMQFKSRYLYSQFGEARDKERHDWHYQYDIARNHALRLLFSIDNSVLGFRQRDAQLQYLRYF